jgi:hypothetical protein
LAPFADNSRAVTAPSPLLAPVMMTVRPVNEGSSAAVQSVMADNNSERRGLTYRLMSNSMGSVVGPVIPLMALHGAGQRVCWAQRNRCGNARGTFGSRCVKPATKLCSQLRGGIGAEWF